jgi:anti-sigma factor RsiW
MTTPLLERAWPACLSALQLDRWLLGELKKTESELVRSHLSGCERCARTVEAMRTQRDATELPRLRLLTVAPAVPAADE